jgi:hypothetical protein
MSKLALRIAIDLALYRFVPRPSWCTAVVQSFSRQVIHSSVLAIAVTPRVTTNLITVTKRVRTPALARGPFSRLG